MSEQSYIYIYIYVYINVHIYIYKPCCEYIIMIYIYIYVFIYIIELNHQYKHNLTYPYFIRGYFIGCLPAGRFSARALVAAREDPGAPESSAPGWSDGPVHHSWKYKLL